MTARHRGVPQCDGGHKPFFKVKFIRSAATAHLRKRKETGWGKVAPPLAAPLWNILRSAPDVYSLVAVWVKLGSA
jgi:hypothetical protein